MGTIASRIVRSGPNITPMRGGGGMAGEGRHIDNPGDQHIALGTIGSGDSDIWARIEGRKAMVEVRLESGAIDDQTIVEVEPHQLGRLHLGQTVLLGFVNGDPSNAYLIGIVDVVSDGIPDTVCRITTGAALAGDVDVQPPPMVPLPLLAWAVTSDGRPWALEAGGDVLVHSKAGMELRAAGTVHVAAPMAVGFGFTAPPVAPTAGVEDVGTGEMPGIPGAAAPPNPISNPTTPPYAGDQDAVVRAKDAFQSNMAIDNVFWTWVVALEAFLTVVGGGNPATFAAAYATYTAVPKPQGLTSLAKSASQLLRAGDAVIPP